MLRILFILAALTTGFAPAAACGPEALGTARVLTVGTTGGGAVGLKTYPRTLQLAANEVVLTFDDGPIPGRTDKVLKALADQCVHATFFMIGRQAEAHAALAQRVLAAGHTVAYHSMSHPIMRRMSDFAARANIENGFRAVDRAVYGKAGDAPRMPFFRYPGFADTPALNAWLGSRNIVAFGADVWASDWLPSKPEVELTLIMARLRKTGGGIVLLHDIQPHTATMMPAFLRALKTDGFHVVHITAGTGFLETKPAPAGWTSETEVALRHTL